MKIGIIGFGNIGKAIAQGLHHSGFSLFSAHPRAAQENFEKDYNVKFLNSNQDVADHSEIVLLCVKPKKTIPVLQDMTLKANTLVISMAAGISIASLKSATKCRVLRCMPNVPIRIQKGVSALTLESDPNDLKIAESLFSKLGKVIRIEEHLFPAITALSGSSPSFIFLIIEALSDGGVKMGLSRKDALLLAAHAVEGAASLVIHSGEHPGLLKDSVTSPGGTAIEGLHTLEKGNIRNTLINAVEDATNKAILLSK